MLKLFYTDIGHCKKLVSMMIDSNAYDDMVVCMSEYRGVFNECKECVHAGAGVYAEPLDYYRQIGKLAAQRN